MGSALTRRKTLTKIYHDTHPGKTFEFIKNVGPKKLLVQKDLDPKQVWGANSFQKNLGLKEILGLKNFFGPIKLWIKNIVNPKKLVL